jgi:hypothetical protein
MLAHRGQQGVNGLVHGHGVLLGRKQQALTDITLIARVQQRIPDRHLAKALGLLEAGIAGAVALAPVIATTIIDAVGVSAGFMLSGASLIVIGAAAALMLKPTKRRAAVPSSADGALRPNALRPAAASDRS